MKGKIDGREVGINYRDFAPPLTVQILADDLDEYQIRQISSPDFIALWEHQWDWLLKQTAGETLAQSWGIKNLRMTARWSGGGVNTFMGIPVRLP